MPLFIVHLVIAALLLIVVTIATAEGDLPSKKHVHFALVGSLVWPLTIVGLCVYGIYSAYKKYTSLNDK